MGSETFVSVDKKIVVYNRTEAVREYNVHDEPIRGLLSIGNHLISFDSSNSIKVSVFLLGFVSSDLMSYLRSSRSLTLRLVV
jgi:hypothetical protein